MPHADIIRNTLRQGRALADCQDRFDAAAIRAVGSVSGRAPRRSRSRTDGRYPVPSRCQERCNLFRYDAMCAIIVVQIRDIFLCIEPAIPDGHPRRPWASASVSSVPEGVAARGPRMPLGGGGHMIAPSTFMPAPEPLKAAPPLTVITGLHGQDPRSVNRSARWRGGRPLRWVCWRLITAQFAVPIRRRLPSSPALAPRLAPADDRPICFKGVKPCDSRTRLPS